MLELSFLEHIYESVSITVSFSNQIVNLAASILYVSINNNLV
jgi:hypothetical protein